MARLDKPNSVLSCPQRFHDAVDAVTGQAEDDLNAPINQRLNAQIGRGLRHHVHALQRLSPQAKCAAKSGVPGGRAGSARTMRCSCHMMGLPPVTATVAPET